MSRLRKPKVSICHVVYVEARSGMSVAGCDGAQEFLEVVVTPEAGEKQVFILAGELSQNEGGQCEESDLGGGQGYDPGSGSDLLRSLIRVNRLPP